MRLLLTLTVLFLTGLSPTATAATFTVSSNADAGAGTLRQAILDANAAAGADEIDFSSAMTIVPAAALPPITSPTTINGRQDPACTGALRNVAIDGNDLAAVGLSFGIGSDGSRVCALNVRDFGSDGIFIESSGVKLDGNRIGTDATGELDEGNDGAGVVITGLTGGGDNTTIGSTTTVSERNTISGNGNDGIAVISATGTPATGTTIAGNFIGTDKDGTTAIPNQGGVVVPISATGTAIAGTETVRQVISGNTASGVDAAAGTVTGNHIGVDLAGTTAVPNTTGVQVNGPMQLGGDAEASRNVISGNSSRGVNLSAGAVVEGNYIGPSADGGASVGIGQDEGVAVQDAADSTTIGGSSAGEGNVIAGNEDEEIETFGAVTGLVVRGNTIGLGADDITSLPAANGIKLSGTTSGAQIGGTAADAGNRIAGHTTGIPIAAGVDVGAADGTIIEGNTFGLAADGTVVGNKRAVSVGSGGDGTRVGGTSVAARNIVAGSTENGISLGGLPVGTSDTTVQGNYIGVAADGITSKPNALGVRVENATDAVISGNVISGNNGIGLFIVGDSSAPVVQGNTIGLGADGTTDVGNGQNGISLGSSLNAQIGGTTSATANTISGNGGDGIELQGGDNVGTAIHGNRIGVAADGVTARGNDGAGVQFNVMPEPVTVGGTGAGHGNTIAHNAGDGVQVIGTNAFGAAFLGNRIHSNGASVPDEIGIDLGDPILDDGVTENDPGDGDGATSPNHLQNFPVLTSAATDGSSTTVAGTIDTTPGRSIRVEVFASSACDPDGHGQGETYLGATTVTAGSGATAFSTDVGGTSAGRQITATATDLTANETSEFSACFTATQKPAPPVTTTTPPPTTTSSDPPPTVTVGPPLLPAPKFPAKMRVLRNGIDDGVLDMLVEITARAETTGADLDIAYESSGRTTRFSVPITGTQIKVRKKLPSSQPKDTGITTVTYAGNGLVDPDEVRLRAADGKSRLVRSSSAISAGRLRVEGTITSSARGVVRIRMSYAKPDASTGFLDFRATVDKGRWALNEVLPAEAAVGGHLSIQFTGYEAKNLRGEQTSKQVP